MDFKWKPGLIRAFESLRVNTCPLNANHRSFTVRLLAIRSRRRSRACRREMRGCVSGDRLRMKDHTHGIVPGLGGQAEARERRSRCLTFRSLEKRLQLSKTRRVSLFLHWVWACREVEGGIGSEQPRADQHRLAFCWPTLQLPKSTAWRWQGLRDESLQLSLCRKDRKNYRSCFIGSGSRGLNELSKATQRAGGKADGTSWALSALRGSSQTTLCFKGSHSTTLWLVYMFKWKTNCSIFVFICTSNICPDF